MLPATDVLPGPVQRAISTDPLAASPTPPRSRPHHVRMYALFFVALLATTIFYLAPASTNCTTTIAGAPGDATAGGVWTAWTYKHVPGPPWLAKTPLTGAPSGERFWEPQFLTAATLLVPTWAISHFTTPQCTWNVMIMLGFLLTGLAMFAFAFWLTGRPLVASFAAFAFTFSPFRMLKAEGHLAYVHAEFLILILFASLLVWKGPSLRRAVLLGGALAAAFYTDGYYVLMAAVLFAVVHLAALAYALFVERWDRVEIRRRVVAVVGAGVVAGLLLVPVAFTFTMQRSELTSQLARPVSEVTTFSSRAVYFVLPPRTHPLFKQLLGSFQDRHLAKGDNYSEATLFVGFVVLALAVGAVVGVVRHRGRTHQAGGSAQLSRGFLAVTLGGTAVVGALMTLPPATHLGGIAIPGPSRVIFHFVTLWRVYARFFIVMHAALVPLAAVGLAALVGRMSAGRGRAVTIAAIVLAALEFLTFPPRSQYDYAIAPQGYQWLASQKQIRTIAEYPLLSTESDPNHSYLTYQPVHGKRMLNSRVSPSLPDGLGRTAFGLGDDGTIPLLRRLGTDAVLVHTRRVHPGAVPPPPDLVLVNQFRFQDQLAVSGPRLQRWQYLIPDYDLDVYRLRPGPLARAGVGEASGFYAPESLGGWKSFTWMRGTARMQPVAFEDSVQRVQISFFAASAFSQPRQLVVTQGGQELWRGTVEQDTAVSFVAAPGHDVELRTTPGDELVGTHDPTSTDPRSIALSLRAVRADPA
jgi:hypothetical protein